MAALHPEYVAGLFDGEGWISIQVNRTSYNKPQYQAVTNLAIRQEWLAEELRRQYGGSVQLHKKRKETHSDSYRWNLSGTKVIDFLKEVGPLLRLKREQAILALQLAERQRGGSNQPISDEERRWRREASDRMLELNMKGRG